MPSKNRDLNVVKKNILGSKPGALKKSEPSSTPKPASHTSTPANDGKLDEVMKELRSMKDLIKAQGERISKLEDLIANLTNNDTSEE